MFSSSFTWTCSQLPQNGALRQAAGIVDAPSTKASKSPAHQFALTHRLPLKKPGGPRNCEGLYNGCCVGLHMNKPILTNLCVFGSTRRPIFRMLAQVLHNFSHADMPVLCNHIMPYHLFDCTPEATRSSRPENSHKTFCPWFWGAPHILADVVNTSLSHASGHQLAQVADVNPNDTIAKGTSAIHRAVPFAKGLTQGRAR